MIYSVISFCEKVKANFSKKVESFKKKDKPGQGNIPSTTAGCEEEDDLFGSISVGAVAVVPHRSRRWCSILPYVLVKVPTMWIVFRVESLSGCFGFVVADLLSNMIAQVVAQIFGIQNDLG